MKWNTNKPTKEDSPILAWSDDWRMKNDPDKLCQSCREFDRNINNSDGMFCPDIWVVCQHENEDENEKTTTNADSSTADD